MVQTPITEPVDKEVQAMFVQGSQDYMWLAEHGLLKVTSMFLASLRRETEQEEALTARLESARDAAVERGNGNGTGSMPTYVPQSEAVPTGDLL